MRDRPGAARLDDDGAVLHRMRWPVQRALGRELDLDDEPPATIGELAELFHLALRGDPERAATTGALRPVSNGESGGIARTLQRRRPTAPRPDRHDPPPDPVRRPDPADRVRRSAQTRTTIRFALAFFAQPRWRGVGPRTLAPLPLLVGGVVLAMAGVADAVTWSTAQPQPWVTISAH